MPLQSSVTFFFQIGISIISSKPLYFLFFAPTLRKRLRRMWFVFLNSYLVLATIVNTESASRVYAKIIQSPQFLH